MSRRGLTGAAVAGLSRRMTDAPSPPFATFTITAEDYADALRLHMRRYWMSRPGPKLFVAAIVAAGLLAGPLSGFDPGLTGAGIGAAIGAVIVPLLSYFFLIPGRARKIHAQQKVLRHPVEVSWNDEAYSAASDASASVVRWGDYHGWSADEKMILLLPSSVLFQMLPRRALSEAQAADLIAHIERSGLRRI